MIFISKKQIWSNVSNLKFTRKEFGEVHIEIIFVRGGDGEGGVLGSTFFPGYGGDIYFDDDENWSLDLISHFGQHSFLYTAVHEIGHALGLKHSEKTTALMEPGISLYQVGKVRLDVDDVEAIQALYGAPGLPRPQVEAVEEVDIKTGNRE